MSSAIELKNMVIRGASAGPRLLITGGVHGDEFEPMAAVRALMHRLQPHELSGTLTLVPVVNEPAFERGQRCGPDGLDLARTFPGDRAGSETQKIAHALSVLIRESDHYIDLHTGGAMLSVWPLAGYLLHPRPDVLEKQRRMARAMNLAVVWGTDPTLNGRSLSVARDANVPAIYAEYGGSGSFDANGVSAYVNGCLSVLRELSMIPGEPSTDAVSHLVEDARPNSGYLQIQNPAPFDGCFEPSVRTGEKVRAGQPLGILSDVMGERVETISSNHGGLVLTLRTFSRVRKDDGLAVILEVEGS